MDRPSAGSGQWLVARVCSEYIPYCERGLVHGTIGQGHRDNSVKWLNDLYESSGALPVVQLKKGHVQTWIESHTTWHSTETHRGMMWRVYSSKTKKTRKIPVVPQVADLARKLMKTAPKGMASVFGFKSASFWSGR